MTDAELVRRLKADFQTARRSNGRQNVLFLELFAGAGGLSQVVSSHKYAVLSIDIKHGLHHDITKPCIWKVIRGWLCSKAICGLWAGTPCSSWSRARHGPPGSNWCTLRDAHHLFGLPNLHSNAQAAVEIGNALMHRTAAAFSLCHRLSIPAWLENPSSSMLWQVEPIARLARLPEANIAVHDACQYGARWRKRTCILSLYSFQNSKVEKKCCGHGGICSRTGKHHIVLKGVEPQSKQLWTKLAEPYPRALCTAYAAHINTTIQRWRLLKLKRLC